MRNRMKSLCALALLAGVGLAAVAGAPGADKKGRALKQKQDNVLVHELQHAYRVLDKANPTYKGHRVKALKEINAAIGELQKEMKKRGLKEHHKDDGRKEPKAVSNAQVVEAAREVGVVLSQLSALPETRHRKKAAGYLGKAVKQLEVALKVAK